MMNNKLQPMVTVVIPTYNNSKTILRAVESVLQQTFNNFEIIIIDDGSIDDTRKVLEQYIEQGKVIYRYQENKGTGAARNAGIMVAQGEYVAFLDADDYWHAEKLERQVQVFTDHPDTIVCSTESYLIDPYSDFVWETKRDMVSAPRSGNIVRFLAFHNIVTLSSAMVRTDVIRNVGMFDDDRTIMTAEDIDLWLKLAPCGSFYAITIPLTFYQTRVGITQDQIKENYRKIKTVFKNRAQEARGAVKFWYTIGWLRTSMLYYIQSMKWVITVKKIGIRGIVKELFRRAYLRIDFLFYPYLIYKLSHTKFSTTDDICNFSYRNSLRLLIPGQVESEIRTFINIAKNMQPKNILEIGTAHGGNLFLLTKLASDGGKIISIDLPNGDFGGGYFARKKALYNKFAKDTQKMFLIRDDSHVQKTLDQVQSILGGEKLDVLFIDADHTYDGVKSDFDMYAPFVRQGGIVAFHDIANAPAPDYGVNKFWNEIKAKYNHQEIIANKDQLGYGIGVLFF